MRKYVLQKRGVIASSAQRKPGCRPSPRPQRPRWTICCRGSRGSTGAPTCSRNQARRAEIDGRRPSRRVPRPPSCCCATAPAPASEIEVFMMVRHYEIDFNSGALVFPGGSVDKGDQEIIARSGALFRRRGARCGRSEFPDRRDPRNLRGKRHPAGAACRDRRPGRCQARRRDRGGASHGFVRGQDDVS